MSTNAVAFLLLNAFREGAARDRLADALDKLRDQLAQTDRDCAFVGDSVDVIDHAVDVLGRGLIKRERSATGEVVIAPVTLLPNVIELHYYANGVLPHFVLEAVIGSSVRCLARQSPTGTIFRNQLVAKCSELCELMQFEFIFTKTCQTLEAALNEVIDTFVIFEILLPQQKVMLIEEQEWSQRYAKHIEGDYDEDFDDDDQDDAPPMDLRPHDLGAEYKVNTDNELQRLYSVLLQPFIDVYVTTTQNLHRLEDRQIPERELLADILKDINTRLETGNLSYNESVSVDTVRNTLKLLEKWEVVECHTQDRIKLYYLGRQYDDESLLAPVVARVQQFQ